MRTRLSRMFSTWLFAGVMLVCGSTGYAATFSLGDVELTSNDTQFSATIPILNLDQDGYSTLGGQVKSENAFAINLDFEVQSGDDGELLLVLTSRDRLTEALAFDIELNYRGETVDRRYTIEPAIPSGGLIKQEQLQFDASGKEQLTAQAFDLSLTHTTHRVKDGQTLWDIALDCREIGGTSYQRAVAIYAANKSMFSRGDINRILQGKQLMIPKKSYINDFEPAEAEDLFNRMVEGKVSLRIDGEPVVTSDPRTTETPAPAVIRNHVDELEYAVQQVRQLENEISKLEQRIRRLERINRDLADSNNAVDTDLNPEGNVLGDNRVRRTRISKEGANGGVNLDETRGELR